jgi:hypothetical protein
VPFEEFPSKDGHLDIIVVQGLLLYSSIGVSTCVGTQQTECHLSFLTSDNNNKKQGKKERKES